MLLGPLLIFTHLYLAILALPEAIEGNGGTCGVQYEPNNVLTEILNEVNFDTNPFFYDILGGYNGGPGFSALVPNIFAQVSGSTISTTSDRPGVIVSSTGYNLGANGAIQVKATFSFHSELVSGVVSSPLGFDEDPFYSAGIFGLYRFPPDLREMYFVVTNNKVYAYISYPGIADPSVVARYLIPVADKTPDTIYTYSVTLSSDYSVSFRINDKEVLRIFPFGRAIDPRFDAGINSGLAADPSQTVPNPVYMIFGLTKLELSTVTNPNQVPRTACQRTLFNQCRQNLRNAFGSNCQYASPLVYNDNAIFEMEMEFEEISAVNYTIAAGCPTEPGCSPKPVTCPRVKPERRRKPRNPMPITVSTTTTTQVRPKPTTTPVNCGCRAF